MVDGMPRQVTVLETLSNIYSRQSHRREFNLPVGTGIINSTNSNTDQSQALLA